MKRHTAGPDVEGQPWLRLPRRRLMVAQQVADGLDDKARQGATMVTRMKFNCDTERGIDCNGCATACKN